ncbi:MAG: ATP-dependent DNA ligase [Microbacterium sp.]|jgi:hypothetical protein|uniref:ATP-dependent DNA ligase n=1 Tax=Microbacterium ginsengisoli TaxID=400772 RepID=A0A0F0LTS3_9MICO|nr:MULTISPECIES: hypothetical protein [Microbacterium]MAL06093.1 ATP-dependent DNA ligase [Microbacterium sp.]MCK9915003.1 ATP-dependent DNA ligase [Microbacteriaceae bacterium K1510]KJL34851.1 hypothetical protein RR49_02740 [Microbacterium ginsengisoli]KJL35064.1 hypothetical protein RR49_02961 [Microbacterium ginsengisoli]KQR90639.1 hypothetical protein ASG00_06270 [Microbacterium sp. Leaf351]|tara:strand:- start:73 stop:459 length:387 start_codon:yes stop_codon:yes gene_type:complete
MGTMFYGNGGGIQVDDRTLEHLRLAVATRLRRGESFMVSMPVDEPGLGSRRNLWVSPAIPLQFIAAGSRMPSLNRLWIQAMGESEDSTGTLTVMPEAEAASYLERKHLRTMNQLAPHDDAPREMRVAG